MQRLAISLVVVGCLAALLGGAADAGSGSHPMSRRILVVENGWGSVKPVKGFFAARPVNCTRSGCSHLIYAHRRHLKPTATPYKGWRFVNWGRACRREKKRTCSLNWSRFLPICPSSIPPVTQGSNPQIDCKPIPVVTARFIAVAPGLTRRNPIPIGASHEIGHGFTMRVNSTQTDVQLASAPGPGQEYLAADVTLTYGGPGSSIPDSHLFFNAKAGGATIYNDDYGHGCPAPGPQPRLDTDDPVTSGQSITGDLCWTITTSDAASLELYFGTGNRKYFPGTTWFALH